MEINCEFRNFSYLNTINSYMYTCNIIEGSITEKDHVIKEFKGDHEAWKNNNDVQRVSFFHDSSVEYFPRGLEKHFPNLTHLDINKCDIYEITRNNLKGLEGLVHLYIIRCQLTTLPDDLFTEMTNLREVSLEGNNIEFASSNLLKPLLGRENVGVSLQGNKSIDAFFWPGDEDSLESLEELMKLIDEKCLKPTQPAVRPEPAVVNFFQHFRHPSSFYPSIVVSKRPIRGMVLPGPVSFNPKLKEMWISGKFSDLTIVAGEKEFKVHKAILGMENPIFAKIFEDQIEATKIKIPEFSSDAVQALLKFIYTNEISKGNAKENFDIANKFKVNAMKAIYEKIICEQVNKENAWETFLLAHRLSSQLLKKKAFQQFVKDIPDEVPDELMEDPETLKKLLDYRRGYDEILILSRSKKLKLTR